MKRNIILSIDDEMDEIECRKEEYGIPLFIIRRNNDNSCYLMSFRYDLASEDKFSHTKLHTEFNSVSDALTFCIMQLM